jgi:hypothetical protein
LNGYYENILGQICERHPRCEWPVDSLPFAAFTLNVGDVCVCDAHTDGKNFGCGLCFISPYGFFDYTAGGHLVLHELKLILELPPGAIAFIPSALITHSNIPIAAGERRQAFTGYTPARMFQWVENGFKKIEDVPDYLKVLQGDQVWSAARNRLPHFTDFIL